MDINSECICAIFEASRAKLNYFYNTLLDENLLWLKEIQEEAKSAFGRESISLLPKTPGIKRKRVVSQQNINNVKPNSPTKCSSTFMDEAESKKLKIDDMSTIIELSDTSVLNDTQNTSKRSLRQRKKKSAPRPIKRSRRIANTRVNNLNKSMESKNSTIVLDTPSPELQKNVAIAKQGKSFVIDNTISSPLICEDASSKQRDSNSTLKNISPINHSVQPHVAALIEQLKMSTQKSFKKADIQPVNNILDDVKVTLFGENSSDEQAASKPQTPRLKKCSVEIERISTPGSITHITSIIPQTPQSVVSKPIETKLAETLDEGESNAVEDTFEVEETMEVEEVTVHNKSCDLMGKETDDRKEGNGDSGISSDEKQDTEQEEQKNHSTEVPQTKPAENNGRRDTYKVMIQEAQLPCVQNPKVQLFNLVQNKPKIVPSTISSNDASPVLPMPNQSSHSSSKGPRIIKPLISKNIVSGVKSFINRTMTPPRKTREEIQQQKEKELEQRELQRQKVVDETNLRKQRLLELRKKQRADREKRLAEQQALRQEEEERKRMHMEARNKKILKNREEIKKQREVEDKKKREVREQKNAIAEARRIREEEEHQRKFREQIEEEERRCEMLKRKAEYEEQERLKKKQQTEKEEKERLRQLEKEKQLQEERKIRELNEKEKHREEVERKLKIEKEKERIERINQEQRLRQAELEIAEATKKRELLEAEKNKPIAKVKQQAKTKVLSPVNSNHKNSPLMKATVQCQKINVPLLPLKLRQSSYTSYDIDDLKSDDSTDDESEPTKRVPSWAQGMELKTQLMHQFYANVNPDVIFVNCMEPCRLDKIFQRNRERYFKRTSSAHWDSPMIKTKVW